MEKFLVAGFVCLSAASLFASPALSEATLLRMGPMTDAPVVDGVIGDAEKEQASASYGLVSAETKMMAVRYNIVYFGWTDSGLYFAARTSLPMSPMKLDARDTVTLELLPPEAAAASRPPCRLTVRVTDGSLVPPSADGDQSPLAKPELVRTAVRALQGIRDYGAMGTETEVFVPFAALGRGRPADGERWGVQMSVHYSSEPETAHWHIPRTAGELGTFIPDRSLPVSGFLDLAKMESWRDSANCRIHFQHHNPLKSPVKIDSKGTLNHGVGFSKLDSAADVAFSSKMTELKAVSGEVAAGKTKDYIAIINNLWPGTPNELKAEFSVGGVVNYRRTMYWDLSEKRVWKSPEPLPELACAFTPSANNRVRAQFDAKGAAKIVSVKIALVDAAGKVWHEDVAKGSPYLKVHTLDRTFPGLPLGDYRVNMEAKNEAGRAYTDYKTFSIRKFPWQGLGLGKERVIVPPYRPIRVEKGEKGEKKIGVENRCTADDKISFLQTGYRCVGLLWDEVYAEGENVLAAPVTMKLNGQEFTVTGTKILEQADDRVIREVTAQMKVEKWESGKVEKSTSSTVPPFHSSTITLTVTQDYDYDGFVMTTWKFDTAEDVKVESLQLSIPMRDSLVSLINMVRRNDKRSYEATDLTVPKGTGEIWTSATNQDEKQISSYPTAIQPYIWMGGPDKGFSWIAESCKDWSVRPDVPAERMIRKDGVLTLVCDFVNRPTVWKAGSREYRMGFQPTPTKPQHLAFIGEAENMWNYPCPSNAVAFSRENVSEVSSTIEHCLTFPDGDTSFAKWVLESKAVDIPEYKRRTEDYVARHEDWLRRSRASSPDAFRKLAVNNFRKMGSLNFFYLDPELVTCMWPEFEMYKAEWLCLDWPIENLNNEYYGSPVPSHCDQQLYDARRALQLGYDGIYYDCFFPRGDLNFAAHPEGAFLDGEGKSHWSLSVILQWRELMKRTAVMCYLNGGMRDGIPQVEIHSTKGHFAPVESWCSHILTTERGGEGGVYQKRFPEGYVLAEITGRQTGSIPSMIVTTRVGDRERQLRELKSLVGFMYAYGLFNLTDQGLTARQDWFYRAWNVPFDFGWGKPNVKPHWYYDGKPQPFVHTGRDVRLTVAERDDGQFLLLFGNLALGETEFAFRPADGRALDYIDVFTRLPVDPRHVRLEGCGYRAIYAVPKRKVAGAPDCLTPAKLGDVKLTGRAWNKVDRFLTHRVRSDFAKGEIFPEARGAFEHPDDDLTTKWPEFPKLLGVWRGEFWGKLMIGATRVAAYDRDEKLKTFLHDEALRLVALQKPDGYLGSYADPEYIQPQNFADMVTNTAEKGAWCWNLWCRKYTLWGLVANYRLTGDRTVLAAAEKAMRQEMAMLKRRGLHLIDTGTFQGLPSMSVLKPLLLLYEDTRDDAYLAFAREIVFDWMRPDGRAPNLLANAFGEKRLADWYPHPEGWAKAYETMSCLDGLLEYYRVTGERGILDAVERIVASLAKFELNAMGTVGYNDQFANAADLPNGVSEPCDTVHWIRLNHDLWRITGKAKYVDAIELAYYNAYLAAIARDGTWGSRAIRSHGCHVKPRGSNGLKHQHCCINNLPRTAMDIAETMVATNAVGDLYVAFYNDGRAKIGDDEVRIAGDYPYGASVRVTVTKARPGKVLFRVPGWSARAYKTADGWLAKDLPAGTSEVELKFYLNSCAFFPCRLKSVPPAAADGWQRHMWANYVANDEAIRAVYRDAPGVTVRRGPVLLAKAKAVGTPAAEIAAEHLKVGESARLSIRRIAAPNVLAAWNLSIWCADGTEKVIPVCDYASAGDTLDGDPASFTVWQ